MEGEGKGTKGGIVTTGGKKNYRERRICLVGRKEY